MKRVAIVSPIRTAVGGFGGSLKSLPADQLAVTALKALLERSKIDPARIDEVISSNSYSSGEAPCMGRYSALDAGLPLEVAGYNLDRRCGSGLQALVNGAMQIQTGASDVVVALGVESMSNIEYYTTDMRWGSRAGSVTMHDRLQRGRERSQPVHRFGFISGMPETAENLAKEYSISREESDAFAVRSQRNAAKAWADNKFANELVPVAVPQKKGDPLMFAKDEGVRGDTTMESLAKLKPVLKDGTVTAGNASQQNDAAAACLLVAEDKLAELGLEPMAWFTGWAAVGCHPATMGIGPVPAVKKLLARTGLGFDQMDVIELNEAFAAQALACIKGWGLTLEQIDERLNVNGGGISLGHPIGATGLRILATGLNELQRRKGRYMLETMCIGGGQGAAAIFERA